MSLYKTSKKIRYTLAIVYILIMGGILLGTYLSQPTAKAERVLLDQNTSKSLVLC